MRRRQGSSRLEKYGFGHRSKTSSHPKRRWVRKSGEEDTVDRLSHSAMRRSPATSPVQRLARSPVRSEIKSQSFLSNASLRKELQLCTKSLRSSEKENLRLKRELNGIRDSVRTSSIYNELARKEEKLRALMQEIISLKGVNVS